MRLAFRLLHAAWVGLVVFHVWLFVSMVADGRLTEPVVAFRWLVAAGLAVGLVALWRAGIPLVASRRGAALWVLVVLLHASAFGSQTGPVGNGTAEAALLFVLPAAAAGVFAATGGVLEHARSRAATAHAAVTLRALWLLDEPAPAASRDLVSVSLPPRAPPLTIAISA